MRSPSASRACRKPFAATAASRRRTPPRPRRRGSRRCMNSRRPRRRRRWRHELYWQNGRRHRRVRRFGKRRRGGGGDVASGDEANKAMDAVSARFGRIDALLNIAGGFLWQKLAEGSGLDAFERMFTINLETALNASLAALPHLVAARAGRIVNVGAQPAMKAAEGMGPYAASKAAVHRLTESLADELKLSGVTVNAVMPSIIDTPANRKSMPKADFSRWVNPADLAAVMLFLASDEARAVTGALIPVSGRV